jgi:hypothetical protein
LGFYRYGDGFSKNVLKSAVAADSVFLAPNSVVNFKFKELFDFDNSSFEPDFYENFASYGHMQPGSYKVVFILIDTNEVVLLKDSQVFVVEKLLPPTSIYPPDNFVIHSSKVNHIIFGWQDPKQLTNQNVHYKIKVWELDTILSNYEILKSVTPKIDVPTISNHAWRPNSPFDFFQDQKIYYWEVQSFKNGTPFGEHDGKGDIVRILIDTGMAFLLEEYTEGPWVDTIGLPPFLPKPEVCEIFDGFEKGFNGWKFKVGEIRPRSRLLYSINKVIPAANGFDPNGFTLHPNGGRDGELNVDIAPEDPFGRYGANIGKVGNPNDDNNAWSMYKSFTVTDETDTIKFWRAAATQAPNDVHGEAESAIGVIRIISGNYENGNWNTTKINSIFTPDNQGCTKTINNWVFSPWRCEMFDLRAFKGQTITLDVTAATCGDWKGGAGNHHSMVYIDFCAPDGPLLNMTGLKDTMCEFSSIIAQGSQSKYMDVAYWDILNSRDGQVYTPVATGIIPNDCSDINVKPRTLNIADYINANDCNTFFKVKLIGKTNCCGRDTISKIFFYSCIDTNLTGDAKCCTNWDCVLDMGKAPIPGNKYQWGPNYLETCFDNHKIAKPKLTFSPTGNCSVIGQWADVTLKITNKAGCVRNEKVRISSSPVNFGIKVDTMQCQLKLTSTLADTLKYKMWWSYPDSWNWVSRNSNFDQLDVPAYTSKKFRLNVQNGCGISTRDTIVGPYMHMFGDFDTLLYNRNFSISLGEAKEGNPSGGDWQIGFQNRNTNGQSRYNAFRWRLDYYDRWGGVTFGEPNATYPNYGYNYNGFENGAIRIKKQELLDYFPIGGAGNIFLRLENCKHSFTKDKTHIAYRPSCYSNPGEYRVVMRGYRNHNSCNGDCFEPLSDPCFDGPQFWKDNGNGHKNLFLTIIPMRKGLCLNHHVQTIIYTPGGSFSTELNWGIPIYMER